MRKTIKNWKTPLWKLVSCLIFLAILFRVFCGVTYLFRNVGYDKSHLTGISEERVDMLYLGGSAAFVYWQPLKAWNDCGITSYLYANNSIQAESLKYMLMESRKSQNPDLYIIDLRPFQYWDEKINEVGLRNTTDSLNITSLNRYRLIWEYLHTRTLTEDTDVLSYYFDIIKYHTNLENLGSHTSWSFFSNHGVSINKGWEWIDQYEYLEPPKDFVTQERAELPEKSRKLLDSLLEYCSKEKLQVLFVVCPYWITREHYAIYNTLQDRIAEYGFGYLNLNDYHEEMGLDFSTDFYNLSHVNAFGAEKYTSFLETYLSTHYDLPDRRGDAQYASWADDYKRFQGEETFYKTKITERIQEVQKGLDMASEMTHTTNASEWYRLVSEDRFALLIAQNGEPFSPTSILDQEMLKGLDIFDQPNGSIRVLTDGKAKATNAAGTEREGITSMEGRIIDPARYHISIEEDQGVSIKIEDVEYSPNQDGLNIVVYDKNYKRVVDSVAIQCENGTLTFVRP